MLIPCRKCLLADIPSQENLLAAIRERIAALPEDEKACEKLQQERLLICRTCDHLLNGMCVLCGCYVELRTARKKMRCPQVPAKWMEGTEEYNEQQEDS